MTAILARILPLITLLLLSALSRAATTGDDYTLTRPVSDVVIGVTGDHYISVNGNDSTGDGSYSNPWATPQKLIDELTAGETGVILPGTYQHPVLNVSASRDGTEANPITLTGLPGLTTILDNSQQAGSLNLANSGLKIYADWWVVEHLTFRNGGSGGIYIGAPSTKVTMNNVVVHDSYMSGIQGANDATYITVKNSLVYNAYNPDRPGDADCISLSGGGNGGVGHIVTDNVVYYCADDGIDVFKSPNCTVTGNVSFLTGYKKGTLEQAVSETGNGPGNGSGFKLGSNSDGPYGQAGNNYVANNVTYMNWSSGFNNNQGHNNVYYNNTSFSNGIYDWRLPLDGATYVNNIAYNSPQNDLGTPAVNTTNSWNLGISDPGLVSYVYGEDGFATPNITSPVVDAGTDVGIPYNGTAPDLGAVETDGLDIPYLIVATDGDDGTGDGTLGNPYRNPEYAIQQAGPGDTVYIREGTYYNHDGDDAVINTGTGDSGTAGNFVVVSGYPGETAIIDADVGGPNQEPYAIITRGTDYIRFQNLTIRNAASTGVYIAYGSTTDPSAFNELVGNVIEQNGRVLVSDCADGFGRVGVYVSFRAQEATIDRNLIRENGRLANPACTTEPDYHNYRHDHGVYAQGKAIITNNVFYDHRAGFHVKLDGYSTGLHGTVIGPVYPPLGPGEFSHYVVGNTFGPNENPNPQDASSGASIRPFTNNPYPGGYQYNSRWYFANNIALDMVGSEAAVLISDTTTSNGTSGNICHNNIAEEASEASGMSWGMCTELQSYAAPNVSVMDNLLDQTLASLNMTDPGNRDYRINSGSVAENAGIPVPSLPTAAYDFDGNLRANPPDVGAYEVQ